MKFLKWALPLLALALIATAGLLPSQAAMAQSTTPVKDHLGITAYDGASTCLECHPAAAQEVMATSHWTWEHVDEDSGQVLGKNNIINNYCIAVSSNEPRCTSCHVGWGYADDTFDFTNENAVDCLVCHDTTGTYKKFPTAAGFPVIGEPKEFSGKVWDPPDLAYIAQNVGATSRDTCGACHFFGGGGDAVKHGDLDSSLFATTADVDVHMGVDGEDFACTECHKTEAHIIPGSTYPQEETDEKLCESCHLGSPHESNTPVEGLDVALGTALNGHTDRIACQTCHIPEFARGDLPTKMFWDWSTAGQKNDDGSIIITKDEATGMPLYDSRKGSFEWGANVVPEYVWFNGDVTYVTLEDTFAPNDLVLINDLHGDRTDTDARIFPVKVFDGVQPYDAGTGTLAVPHLFGGDENAYWKNWDWAKALAAGQASVDREFSGEVGWIQSRMFWVQNHMVAPADMALGCDSCHAEEGRLDFAALGYTEGEAVVMASFPPVAPEPEPTAALTDEPVEESAQAAMEEEPAQVEEAVVVEAQAEEPVEQPAEPAEEPAPGTPSWAYGLIGLVVLAAGGFFYRRFAAR